MSRKQADLVFSLVLLVVVAWMVWEAGKWDLRARLFPVAVGLPAIGLALLQLGLLLKPSGSRAAVAAPESATLEDSIPPEVVRTRSLHMVGWVLAITLGIVLLGFELGAGLLTFAFLRFAAHERLRTSLLIALATYLSFYIVFDRALFIPFPPGAVAETVGLSKPIDHYVMDPVASLIQRG